jgi:hypothetical protein
MDVHVVIALAVGVYMVVAYFKGWFPFKDKVEEVL